MLGSFTVPPQKPLIVDDRGRQVEGEVGIGPFREGESLSLECNVPGGKCSGLRNGAKFFMKPPFNSLDILTLDSRVANRDLISSPMCVH